MKPWVPREGSINTPPLYLRLDSLPCSLQVAAS